MKALLRMFICTPDAAQLLHLLAELYEQVR